jgi:pimeloyl-ACP methyl ester carboxylesterase
VTLSLTTIPASSGQARDVFVFLHGILGSGANWRGFAKRLLESLPDTEAWLVDLRLHGRSSAGFAPPHTVEACATDLVELVAARGGRVTRVLGHSFGGKVALAYAKTNPALDRVFVVDSNPGPRPSGRGSETTLKVIELLGAAPPSYASREAFATHFRQAGLEPGIVAWLGMNLVAAPSGEGFVFRIDLGAVHALLDDYLFRDLFPVVEHAVEGSPTKFVFYAGEFSGTLDDDARTRLRDDARSMPNRVALEVIPGAGHWVHVDAPDALRKAIEADL